MEISLENLCVDLGAQRVNRVAVRFLYFFSKAWFAYNCRDCLDRSSRFKMCSAGDRGDYLETSLMLV